MANDSIFPSPDILNEAEYGKFVLTNLAAKRAMQIKDGAPPLVRIESSHPLSIALAEIAAGKIKPLLGEEAEAVEAEQKEAIEEFGIGGLLLPSLDDEDGSLDSVSGDDNEVAATSTSLLANLLAEDGDGDSEPTPEPSSEPAPISEADSKEISLDDLAAREKKEASSGDSV